MDLGRDPVTGGGQESWLEQKFEEIRALGGKCALVWVNIKRFLYYRCRYGKAGSDEILKTVYDIIWDNLRDGECAARIYADNFVLLLRCHGPKDVIERIELLDWAVYRHPDDRIHRDIFLSMGIYPDAGRAADYDEASIRADLARRCCPQIRLRNSSYELYDQKACQDFLKSYEIERKTVRAHRDGRFSFYLQPKVRLSDQRVAGAELLLRWIGKDGEPAKNDFIPVIDQNGYMREVDLCLFEDMCRMMQQRLEQGLFLVPVSFNLSGACYETEHFMEAYLDIYRRYRIPASFIEFELLETGSLYDTDLLIRAAQQIRKAGFGCLLDDFGSGFSTLGVLSHISADGLKIDRSFFDRGFQGKDRLIVKTIIDLAKELGMKITAEGVETMECAAYLRSIGCDMIQGYCYYRPMALQDFFLLLDETARSSCTECSFNPGTEYICPKDRL